MFSMAVLAGEAFAGKALIEGYRSQTLNSTEIDWITSGAAFNGSWLPPVDTNYVNASEISEVVRRRQFYQADLYTGSGCTGTDIYSNYGFGCGGDCIYIGDTGFQSINLKVYLGWTCWPTASIYTDSSCTQNGQSVGIQTNTDSGCTNSNNNYARRSLYLYCGC